MGGDRSEADAVLRVREGKAGKMLGWAVRIFMAVSKAEPGIDFSTRKHWIYYTSAASGTGYVGNLIYWFPELKSLEQEMQEAARCESHDAQIGYKSGHNIFTKSCRCNRCNPKENKPPFSKYCLVVTAETILKLALILSNVSVKSGLNPIRSGFERLYDSQVEARQLVDGAYERIEKSLGPIVWVNEPEKEDKILCEIDQRMQLIVDGALGHFTNLQEVKESFSCATPSGGICAYKKSLEDFSVHANFEHARIQIVPDSIEWEGIAFTQAQDQPMGSSLRNFHRDSERTASEEIDARDLSSMIELEVTQMFSSLIVAFRLSTPNGNVFNIPPTGLENAALTAYGLFQCQCQEGKNQHSHNDLKYQARALGKNEAALY